MAEEIAHGAKGEDVTVMVKRVEDCKLEDLAEADGIVVGSPTYFSNIAWQVKKFIDESITLYSDDCRLRGRVGGCFTSAGSRRNGEDCIKMLEIAFGFHHKLQMLPGIIQASGDSMEDVSKICQEYGMTITKKIASK
jgi:multimeric flavodoxin WrbA